MSNAILRTSKSNPIRVDFLSSKDHGLAGRIGLTIAPGKKDRARAWDRDLAEDLERLKKHYKADLLVSLMQKPEYRLLRIPDLLDRAGEMEIETLWFPIRDVDAPPAKAMSKYVEMVRQIVATAGDGKTVVIHCRGGVGRSGVVAATCLVALGHEPDNAIRRVRAIRAGAIEVPSQERWVAAFAKQWPQAGTTPKPSIMRTRPSALPQKHQRRPTSETFVGCLLGGALGDALGYPIEFDKGTEIVRRFGINAPGKLNYAGGKVALISDDTQMTLFTAEGLIRAWQRGSDRGICHPPSVIARALLRWHTTQGGPPARTSWPEGWLVTERRLHDRRAPGNTCMSALSTLSLNSKLPSVTRPPNDSKGCGAVMRVAPCGLGAGSRESAFELARDSGVLTHGHPSGYLSAAYFASVIWDLARGHSLRDAMPEADKLLSKEKGGSELARILDKARKAGRKGPPDMKTIEALGGGWTGEEALAIALVCALTFDPASESAVETTLWRAAAHSGDSDSTAAITGNLLGAMVGVGGLPKRWLAALELRDVIERIAHDLHRAMIFGEDLDHDAYPPN